MFENRTHWADKAFWWIAPIVIVAAAGGGAYYYFHSRHDNVEPKAQADAAPPAESTEPAHPIPSAADAPSTQPLPPLNESDPPLRDALEKMFGDVSVKQMLVPQDIVRRTVVTIDNLSRQKVAVEKRPLKAVAGQTAAKEAGDVITLGD